MFDIILLFILLIILYYYINNYIIIKENITNTEPRWYSNIWYGNLYLKNDKKTTDSLYYQDLYLNKNNASDIKTNHFTPYQYNLLTKNLFDYNNYDDNKIKSILLTEQQEFVNIKEDDNNIDLILLKYRENNIPNNQKIKDIYDNLIPTYKHFHNK